MVFGLTLPGMMYGHTAYFIQSTRHSIFTRRWPRVDSDKVSQPVHPTLVSYVSFSQHLEVERCAPWCGTWRSVTMPTCCIFMRLWWVTFRVEFHLERQSCVMYLVRRWRTSHTFTSCTSNISVSCPYVHRPCPFGLEGLANLCKLFESLLSHQIDVDYWLLQFTVFAGCSL